MEGSKGWKGWKLWKGPAMVQPELADWSWQGLASLEVKRLFRPLPLGFSSLCLIFGRFHISLTGLPCGFVGFVGFAGGAGDSSILASDCVID